VGQEHTSEEDFVVLTNVDPTVEQLIMQARAENEREIERQRTLEAAASSTAATTSVLKEPFPPCRSTRAA
jgi:hypothetical protein